MGKFLILILESGERRVFQYWSWFSVDTTEQPLVKGLVHAVKENDWKLSVIAAITFMLVFTYSVTSLRAVLAMRSSKQHGKRPPTVPYWVPFVGNLISYMWDGPALAAKVVEKFGQSVPAGIRLGLTKIYLVGDPDHINILLKPRPAISSVLSLVLAMENIFGTPKDVLPLYIEDDSGPHLKPIPGSKVQPENRVRFLHTKNIHKHLGGSKGVRLGEIYMAILSRNLSADAHIGVEWTHFPDLWIFIRDMVFLAGVESVCGSSILSLNPTLVEDFWAFEQVIPTLMKGLPRWLCPEAFRRRDKVLNLIKKWHKFADEKSDFTKTGLHDPEWDEDFGSKYVRGRQHLFYDLDLMNAHGRSSEDLGLLFALSGNSVPLVFWTVFEVFTRPGLLSRVRDIAQSAHDTRAQDSESIKLSGNPLLQSIFAESTRLRTVGIIFRVVVSPNFQLGEWGFPNGSILGIPSLTGAMNKNIWNTGTEADPHSLDKFWEERFLIYPDKPNSGPRRRQEITVHPSKRENSKKIYATKEQGPSEPSFSLAGLGGAYLPFGGGPSICPGRHFARQEVTSTLAKLAQDYDIEIQVPCGWEPKMNIGFFPIGVLPPVDKVAFRIRRRLEGS